jgi:hypothetical protein
LSGGLELGSRIRTEQERDSRKVVLSRHFRAGVENKRFNTKGKEKEKITKEEEFDLHRVLKPTTF